MLNAAVKRKCHSAALYLHYQSQPSRCSYLEEAANQRLNKRQKSIGVVMSRGTIPADPEGY